MDNQNRSSFVFYESWLEAIKNLPRDIQGDVLTAIIEYGLYGETTDNLKPITKAMLEIIKPQIDSNRKRYENGKKGAEYGRLGGRPKKNNPKETPTKPLNNPKETPIMLYDNVSDKSDIKETSLTRGKEGVAAASPPSASVVAEVSAHKNDKIPAKEIMEMWNANCTSYPKLIAISENRKNKIRLRIEEMGGVEKSFPILKTIFEKMQISSFLKGDNKRGWKATFDWLFENGKNWVKVWEGNYDNHQSGSSSDIGVVLKDNSPNKYDNDSSKWNR